MIMKRQLSEPDQSIANSSKTDWQKLGELKLPFGVDAEAMINAWLSKTLAPLHLHVGFLNKVLASAREAATRAMQSEPVMAFDHIHLLVFALRRLDPTGQTWGFFRIEKMDGAADVSRPNHAIEFYLYLER
jgi:hypothetical protein